MQHQKPAVGMIGLGIMGSAMSVNLQAAGFSVMGSDPRASQRRLLKAKLTAVTPRNADLLGHSLLLITS
ncbi:MAG: NAD(P)-binding domain-containing protein, partial [Proteobacteria bacterium]|nr:NAD(P)-binding domain-containing protein [Pseudomonadota bacterium]